MTDGVDSRHRFVHIPEVQGTGQPDSPLSGPVHAQPSCGGSMTERKASDTAKIDDGWISGSTGRAAHSPGSAAAAGPAPVIAATSTAWVDGSQYPERFPVRSAGVAPSPESAVVVGADSVVRLPSPVARGEPDGVDGVVGVGEVVTVDPMPSTSLTAHPNADAADAGSEMPRGSDSSARSTVPAAIRVSTRVGEASGSRSISMPMTPSWRCTVLAAAASRGSPLG